MINATANEARAVGDLLVELDMRLNRLAGQQDLPSDLRSFIDDTFQGIDRGTARRFYDAAETKEDARV